MLYILHLKIFVEDKYLISENLSRAFAIKILYHYKLDKIFLDNKIMTKLN